MYFAKTKIVTYMFVYVFKIKHMKKKKNLFKAQTVLTLIRLLLEEESDLGPHSLQKWLL